MTVEISSLGEIGSGADATILIGSSPRLMLTLSTNRLHVRTTDGQQETTCPGRTRRPSPAAGEHANGLAAVSVDDKPLVTLPAAVKGGIGLGIWRENEASPTPVFAGLEISRVSEQ